MCVCVCMNGSNGSKGDGSLLLPGLWFYRCARENALPIICFKYFGMNHLRWRLGVAKRIRVRAYRYTRFWPGRKLFNKWCAVNAAQNCSLTKMKAFEGKNDIFLLNFNRFFFLISLWFLVPLVSIVEQRMNENVSVSARECVCFFSVLWNYSLSLSKIYGLVWHYFSRRYTMYMCISLLLLVCDCARIEKSMFVCFCRKTKFKTNTKLRHLCLTCCTWWWGWISTSLTFQCAVRFFLLLTFANTNRMSKSKRERERERESWDFTIHIYKSCVKQTLTVPFSFAYIFYHPFLQFAKS